MSSLGTIRNPAVCGPFLLQFLEKSPHRLSKVWHFFDSKCAGNLWSWRIEWRDKRRNLTECGRSRAFWNVEVGQKLSLKSAKKLTKKHFIFSTRPIQTWWDQLQKVKRWRLARKDQSFPAQAELLLSVRQTCEVVAPLMKTRRNVRILSKMGPQSLKKLPE